MSTPPSDTPVETNNGHKWRCEHIYDIWVYGEVNVLTCDRCGISVFEDNIDTVKSCDLVIACQVINE
jgi:hypothetical protein